MDLSFYEQQTWAVRCRLQGEKSPIAIVKHDGHKSIQVLLNDSPSLQFVQALRLRMQCQKKFEAMYVRLENREPVKNLDTAISLREQEDFKKNEQKIHCIFSNAGLKFAYSDERSITYFYQKTKDKNE